MTLTFAEIAPQNVYSWTTTYYLHTKYEKDPTKIAEKSQNAVGGKENKEERTDNTTIEKSSDFVGRPFITKTNFRYRGLYQEKCLKAVGSKIC